MAEDPLLNQAVDRSDQRKMATLPQEGSQRRCKSIPDSRPKHKYYDAEQHKPILEDKLDFRVVFAVLALYVSLGTLVFYLVRAQMKGMKTNEFVDAIYFCIVTMTTVGYGDLVPDTRFAKVLALVFVFIGMALVGFLLSKAADTLVENQEVHLVKAMQMREKNSPADLLLEAETNKVKYKFITISVLLVLVVVLGITFLIFNQEMTLFDAFYCVCATITTLGYGDSSFITVSGRLFAAVWILISTICLAQFFYTLAELYTERRRKSLVSWVLTRKLTVSDLEAADLDNDKQVSLAEFVVYKMKEMGKITDDDIQLVTQWFKVLDVDQSGTLTKDDLRSSWIYIGTVTGPWVFYTNYPKSYGVFASTIRNNKSGTVRCLMRTEVESTAEDSSRKVRRE